MYNTYLARMIHFQTSEESAVVWRDLCLCVKLALDLSDQLWTKHNVFLVLSLLICSRQRVHVHSIG